MTITPFTREMLVLGSELYRPVERVAKIHQDAPTKCDVDRTAVAVTRNGLPSRVESGRHREI